jgi:hypothetical protein
MSASAIPTVVASVLFLDLNPERTTLAAISARGKGAPFVVRTRCAWRFNEPDLKLHRFCVGSQSRRHRLSHDVG